MSLGDSLIVCSLLCEAMWEEQAMYYIVPFDCTCEECGSKFSGLFYRMVPQDDTSPLGSAMSSGMKALAETVDARNTRKSLERRLQDKRWSQLSSGGIYAGVSYGDYMGHSCPHCGARQSWDPMTEPKEPEKKSGKLFYMVIGAIFCGIIGMLAGLFLMIAFDGTAFFISMGVGAAVGAVLGNVVADGVNKEEVESYEKRRSAYETDLAAYRAFQESLSQRTQHNEPVPKIDQGSFATDISISSRIVPHKLGCCPHCGKKLEGIVGITSVQVARARNNCCPWCGEMLPANIRMKVGSE